MIQEIIAPNLFREPFLSKQLRIIKLLVESGFDLNDTTYIAEITPLEASISSGASVKLIEYLLSLGADPNLCSIGNCPLYLAAEQGNLPIIKTLLRVGVSLESNLSGETPLINAASSGQMSVVDFLVKIGANVNALTEYGQTALLRAAENGHEEIVNYLLPLTSDLNHHLLARKFLPEGIHRRKEREQQELLQREIEIDIYKQRLKYGNKYHLKLVSKEGTTHD